MVCKYRFLHPLQITRKRFQRIQTLVGGIDHCWQIDLTVLDPDTSVQNDGFKYILFVIDVFSKYAWASMLKNKGRVEVTNALETVLDTSKRGPYSIQSDKGTEFYSMKFQNLLKQTQY